MDGFVFIVGIVLFVWVWRLNAKRKREREEELARWQDLTARMYALERTLQKVRAELSAQTGASQEAAWETVEYPAATTATPPSPPPVVATPSAPPIVEPAPSVRIAEAWVTRKAKAEEEAPAVSSYYQAGVVSPSSAPTAPPPPTFALPEPAPSLAERFKSSLDLEEALGTNWLNKLGIVILVLGVAFFLAYQVKTLGPAGKVLVGFVTSGVMLGTGIWFERKQRYSVPGACGNRRRMGAFVLYRAGGADTLLASGSAMAGTGTRSGAAGFRDRGQHASGVGKPCVGQGAIFAPGCAERRRNPCRAEPAKRESENWRGTLRRLVGAHGFELEPLCGRERSRGPRHARFSRDGVEEREPAGEILNGVKDPQS